MLIHIFQILSLFFLQAEAQVEAAPNDVPVLPKRITEGKQSLLTFKSTVKFSNQHTPHNSHFHLQMARKSFTFLLEDAMAPPDNPMAMLELSL